MVAAAQDGQVVRGRWPWLWSAFAMGVVVERFDVIEVTRPRGAGAPGKHARLVSQSHLAAEPGGRFVAAGADLLVEIDDRQDPDLGVGGVDPGPDLRQEGELLPVLQEPDGRDPRGVVGLGLRGEVQVQVDSTGLRALHGLLVHLAVGVVLGG